MNASKPAVWSKSASLIARTKGLARAASAAPLSYLGRFSAARIPDQPHLDDAGSAYFAETLARCRVYLEYGSGASTVLAYRMTKRMISVETDRRFLKATRRALRAIGEPHAKASLIFAGIGFVEEWGAPRFKRVTPRRLRRWANYVAAPWRELRSENCEPDLILVDGRFRVACVLQAVLNLSEQSDCLILLDDYLDRPAYQAVEQFVEVEAIHGRMAVLRKKKELDSALCREQLIAFQRQWQ